MMKRLKKTIPLLLILALIAAMLSACAGTTNTDDNYKESSDTGISNNEDDINDENNDDEDKDENPVDADEDQDAADIDDNMALPDLGASVFSAGELIEEGYVMDGVAYEVYGYTWEKESSSSITNELQVYRYRVTAAGFGWEQDEALSEGDGFSNSTFWYKLSGTADTAWLSVNGSYFSSWCTGTLYVPEGMSFTLEEDVGHNYSFQNDIYVDSDDLNTPDSTGSTIRCVSCHGTGICGNCGGDGWWTNPYTGHPLECSSCKYTDGACSVCDGTGYW